MRKQIEEMQLEIEQYQKSNLALNLMIDELKLKMEGIRNEWHAQDERCSISERFLEKFRRDLQDLWSNRQDLNGAFKSSMIKMYRMYVQEDLSIFNGSHKSHKNNNNNTSNNKSNKQQLDIEDPQQVYNRDREQMERSLDSLRRAMKTEALAHRRDLGKMMRESVLLTKELNSLRKAARNLYLQKKAIDSAGELTAANNNLLDLMTLLGLEVKTPGINNTTNNNTYNTTSNNNTSQGKKSHPLGGAGGGGIAEIEQMISSGKPAALPGTGRSASAKRQQHLHAATNTRSAALRTTSADGVVTRAGTAATSMVVSGPGPAVGETTPGQPPTVIAGGAVSRQDQWEAWREIQMQYDTMKQLEDAITNLCQSMDIDPVPLIVAVDSKMYDS